MFLENGRSWLLAPVEAGMCSYREVTDGSLDLYDIWVMNEYLAAKAENQRRAYQATKDAR